MTCGKVYKWTSKESRDIPLPEIAQEILQCNSALIYKYLTGEAGEFDIIVGCKTKEDAVNLVVRTYNGNADEVNEYYIRLWEAQSWFTERKDQKFMWDWTKKTPNQLYLPEIAQSIITHNADKIFRVERTGIEIVTGAKNKEQAVDVALEFWYEDFEQDFSGGFFKEDLSWDDDMDHVNDVILDTREEFLETTSLWKVGEPLVL